MVIGMVFDIIDEFFERTGASTPDDIATIGYNFHCVLTHSPAPPLLLNDVLIFVERERIDIKLDASTAPSLTTVTAIIDFDKGVARTPDSEVIVSEYDIICNYI